MRHVSVLTPMLVLALTLTAGSAAAQDTPQHIPLGPTARPAIAAPAREAPRSAPRPPAIAVTPLERSPAARVRAPGELDADARPEDVAAPSVAPSLGADNAVTARDVQAEAKAPINPPAEEPIPALASSDGMPTAGLRRIDINRADTTALQTLPGIGAQKAAAIVAFRERTPFRTVRQLVAVRGIGPRTLERIRPMVYVDAAETNTVASAR